MQISSQSSLVITPNRRMALFLIRSGKCSEPILPLSQWLESLYSELVEKDTRSWPKLLSNHEEMVVWNKIVSSSEWGEALLKPYATARLARDAYNISKAWQLLPFDEKYLNEDLAAFQEWISLYEAECQAKFWIDSNGLLKHLVKAIKLKMLALPDKIRLMGFEEMTPALSSFFKSLDSNLEYRDLLEKCGEVYRCQSLDFKSELQMACDKAKHLLSFNKDVVMGIVVPNLQEERKRVIRILTESLGSVTFNVAAPMPLSHSPMIEAALLFLSFFQGEIPFESFSRFIRSVFFANEKERVSLAALDLKIRNVGEETYTLERFIQKAEHIIKNNPSLLCGAWLERLKACVQYRSALQQKQTPEEFKNIISQLLNTIRWPGEMILSSEEELIKQQWDQCLLKYVDMVTVFNKHRFSESLTAISRILEDTPFTAPTFDASVQVLGVLEALGLPFDYLWVTGMHQKAWPAEPAPNPFIPIALQRERGVPRSSAARELEMAKKFTNRLTFAAPEVMFSYPQEVADTKTKVSALIEHFPEISNHSNPSERGATANLPPFEKGSDSRSSPPFHATANLPPFQRGVGGDFLPDRAPALFPQEIIKGGSTLLKLQSLCPFRAFAESRLQAKPIPIFSIGLTPAERGEIIHQVLHLFWENLQNQSQLLALSEEALLNRISHSIEIVFKNFHSKFTRRFEAQYLQLEKNRTQHLIQELIHLEKQRPYFEVLSREVEKVVELQGLQFKIRIDRIDRLENGQEILIDYKTGEVSLSHWFGERLRDPQMPFYGVTRDPKPAGLMYAILRPGDLKFQGLSQAEKLLPGIKSISQMQSYGAEKDFDSQFEVWQKTLATLVNEFKAGVATVTPLGGTSSCRTCSLTPLCRVYENKNN